MTHAQPSPFLPYRHAHAPLRTVCRYVIAVLLAMSAWGQARSAEAAWPQEGDVLVLSSQYVFAVDGTGTRTLIADVGTFTDPEIYRSSAILPNAVVMSRDGVLWLAYRNSYAAYTDPYGNTCTNGLCGGVLVRVNQDGTHAIVRLGAGLYPMGLAAAPDGSVVIVTGSSTVAGMFRVQAVDATTTSPLQQFVVPQTLVNPACATPTLLGYRGKMPDGSTSDDLSRPYLALLPDQAPIAAAQAAGIVPVINAAGQYVPVLTDSTGYIVDPPGYVAGGNICDADAVGFREARGVAVDQATGNIYVGDVEGGTFASSASTVPYCEQIGYNDCGGLFQLAPGTLIGGQKTLVSDFDNPAKGPLGEDAGSAVALLGSQFVVTDGAWWIGHDLQNSTSDPCATSPAPASCYVYGAVYLVSSTGTRTLLSAFGNAAQGQSGNAPHLQLPMAVTLDGTILVAGCDTVSGVPTSDAICTVDGPADANPGFRTLWVSFGGTFNGKPLGGVTAMSVVLPLIVRTSTTTSLTQSTASTTYGEGVTFTAAVTGSGGQPSGSVTFFDGTTSLGTAAVVNGFATLLSTTLTAGSHAITASYGGDGSFASSSSSALTHVVGQASVNTTIASDANPAAVGQPVTITVSVLPEFAGVPTGTVTIYDGPFTLTSQAVGPTGVVQVTTTTLSAGGHPLTASYLGDANFLPGSSPTLNQVVGNAADLAVTTGATPATPRVGGNVTLVVDVHNNGPNDVASATVQVALPSTLTFVSASSAGFNPVTGLWTIGALANGATAELQIVTTITGYVVEAAASIVSASAPDQDLLNNTASVQIQPGNVIYVNGLCTLRAAIVAANTDAPSGGCQAGSPGLDVIVLPPGSSHIYSDAADQLDAVNGYSATPAVYTPIQIEGRGSVVGRSTAPGTIEERIFLVKVGGALTLHQVTVRDGYLDGPGGGILLQGKGASLVLDSSSVINNTTKSYYGGGIASSAVGVSDDGDITIRDSYLGGNQALNGINTPRGGFGGAIAAARSLSISNTTIGAVTAPDGTISGTNFAAQSGGGVYFHYGVATVAASSIVGNVAGVNGGGLWNSGGSVTVDGSHFDGNAASYGGGIANAATLTLRTSTVDADTAVGPMIDATAAGMVNFSGGTINVSGSFLRYNSSRSVGALWNQGYATLTDTEVSSNSSSATGAGGIANAGLLTLVRGSVKNNSAAHDGGGIQNLLFNDVGPTAALVVDGTTFTNNTAGTGGGAISTYGPAMLTNVTIGGATDDLGNVAEKAGGGILVSGGAAAGLFPAASPSLGMTGGAILHNSAKGAWDTDGGGGGLANGDSNTTGGVVSLTDVQVANNFVVNNTGDGGGIFNRGSLTVLRGTIENNSAASGGGIGDGSGAFAGGSVVLTNATVSSNTAAAAGGNISSIQSGGSIAISGGSINSGIASRGAGIYSASPLTLSDGVVIENNSATGYGAGVAVVFGATLTATDTTFRNNTIAKFYGGAVYGFHAGEIRIDRSTLTGNTADGAGSAFDVTFGAALTVTNSTISGNGGPFPVWVWNTVGNSLSNVTISGNNAGSSVLMSSNGLDVQSTTIAANVADSPFNGTVSFENSIVAGNKANWGGYYDCDPTALVTITANGSNLFGNWGGCPIGATDHTVDPATVFTSVLGPLADNGGPTLTHALLAGSPALDAGADTCPATDQRGLPRPQDGTGTGVARCDIGSVEQQTPFGGGGAGPATHFMVSAPPIATAGTAFSFTITARDAGNNIDAAYTGRVHVTSSDPGATLPPDSTLVNGTATFNATLLKTGVQTLSATDVATAITGTSGGITVTAAIQPPSVTKAFAPASIPAGTVSVLTFTLSNPNKGTTLTGVAVTDPLPADLVVAGDPAVANTCGGTVAANAGSSTIALSGGSIAQAASCQISVSVTALTQGLKANVTGVVSSSNGGNGNTAQATLTVTAPVLRSLAIAPLTPSLEAGTTLPFVATGTYTDGSTQNVSASAVWASATTTVATITAAGVASAVTPGTSVIAAALDGQTASTVLTVTRATTTTGVTASPSPSKAGQTFTVTATVTGDSPTGSVTFTVDGGLMVLGPVPLGGGIASTPVAALPPGTHTIVAAFGGDALNDPSTSAAFSQVVNTGAVKAASNTTLTLSTTTAVAGQPVTMTVSVTGTNPTGTVTISDQKGVIGTVPLDAGGFAQLTTATLSKGTHQITASYSGDAVNQPGTSAKVKLQVK